MAKSYVFGKMLPREEPLVAFKVFKYSFLTETEERDRNFHILANSRWKRLTKAVGQSLGSAKRV
jgi:hypothetical protein